LSITLGKWPKIQNTFNESNLNAKYIQESYSFNIQEKHKPISRLGIGTVTMTVQCTVNKKNPLKILTET